MPMSARGGGGVCIVHGPNYAGAVDELLTGLNHGGGLCMLGGRIACVPPLAKAVDPVDVLVTGPVLP